MPSNAFRILSEGISKSKMKGEAKPGGREGVKSPGRKHAITE